MSRQTQLGRRRWTSGSLASMGLHLLAVLALASVFGARLKGAWGSPRQTAMQVTLVRFPKSPDGVSLHRTAPTPAPTPAPPLKDAEVASLSEDAEADVPAVPAAPPADPVPVDPSGDIDGLYRAPFRDAIGQAYASLRGGLGCAHVDLDALPANVRALCDAAHRS